MFSNISLWDNLPGHCHLWVPRAVLGEGTWGVGQGVQDGDCRQSRESRYKIGNVFKNSEDLIAIWVLSLENINTACLLEFLLRSLKQGQKAEWSELCKLDNAFLKVLWHRAIRNGNWRKEAREEVVTVYSWLYEVVRLQSDLILMEPCPICHCWGVEGKDSPLNLDRLFQTRMMMKMNSTSFFHTSKPLSQPWDTHGPSRAVPGLGYEASAVSHPCSSKDEIWHQLLLLKVTWKMLLEASFHRVSH